MKVLVLSKLDEEGIRLLREKHEVEIALNLSDAELVQKVADADALIVRAKPEVRKPLIEKAPHLKVVGRAGVGVDNIDVAECERRGIKVLNAPMAATNSVAELVFSLMASFARSIPRADKTTKEGLWLKSEFVGFELRGKTLGIVGFGRIGFRLAEIALAFGMKVLAYDVVDIKALADRIGAKVVPLEKIIEESDIISLHVPLLDSTRNLISRSQIAKMKSNALLINTSRGGIVNEKDLHEALRDKKIAGACLDVFEHEPLKESPLFTLDNVILTPHIAASTKEGQKAAGTEIAHKVLEALK